MAGENGEFSNISENQAIFVMYFMSPARVSVKEEYLVYDLVSVISTLEGTIWGYLLDFHSLALQVEHFH